MSTSLSPRPPQALTTKLAKSPCPVQRGGAWPSRRPGSPDEASQDGAESPHPTPRQQPRRQDTPGDTCWASCAAPSQGNWPPHTQVRESPGQPRPAPAQLRPLLEAAPGRGGGPQVRHGRVQPRCPAQHPGRARWPAPCLGSGQAAGPRVRLAEHGLGGPLAISRRGAQRRGAQCHWEPGGGRRAEPSELMSIFCIKYFDN